MTESEDEPYHCTLAADVLTKACEELNEPEDNTDKQIAINKLRDAFRDEHQGIAVFEEELKDSFVLRFLRARKFDQERALLMMKNYASRRKIWPELFEKIDSPSCLAEILDRKLIAVLDGVAKDGSSIIMLRPGADGKHMFLVDMFACVFLSMEKLLENEDVQVHGITIVEDFKYATLGIAKQMGPSLARKFLAILQDTMPIRLKSVNMLHEPRIFDMIFAIVRPFMKDKTRNRICFVGSKYSLLHERIDPTYLPAEYGGMVSKIDYGKWKANLLEDPKL